MDKYINFLNKNFEEINEEMIESAAEECCIHFKNQTRNHEGCVAAPLLDIIG